MTKELFVVVPMGAVHNKLLSAQSKAAVLYFYSMPGDSGISPKDVQEALGFGYGVWSRVSRELREAGVLSLSRTHNGTVIKLNRNTDEWRGCND